jgi:hypothetical protein
MYSALSDILVKVMNYDFNELLTSIRIEVEYMIVHSSNPFSYITEIGDTVPNATIRIGDST